MKLPLPLLLTLALSLTGCAKPKPYIRIEITVNDQQPEVYWQERHKTTFHGICAHMYYGSLDKLWVIEHPHWLAEPDVARVADGLPYRMDRIRGLGNAVVPQIPELFARRIHALLGAHR